MAPRYIHPIQLIDMTSKAGRISAADRDVMVAELADAIGRTFAKSTAVERTIGRQWYANAKAICQGIAGRNNLTLDQVIDIMALVSPRCRWAENVARAEAIAELMAPIDGLFPYIPARITAILASPAGRPDLVRGEKVSRFRLNIRGDYDHATVDIWAIRDVFGRLDLGDDDYKALVGTPTRYAIVEDAYRLAAGRLTLTVAQLQAINWVTVQRIAEEKAGPNLPAPF